MKNKFKTIMATYLLFTISVSTLFFIGLNKQMKRQRGSLASNIGEVIVIGKDSLVVTDYSTIFDTYTLSNGNKVSVEYVLGQLND